MHTYLQVVRLEEENVGQGRILNKVPRLSSLSPWAEFKFKQTNKKEMHTTSTTQLSEDRGKPALLGRMAEEIKTLLHRTLLGNVDTSESYEADIMWST